MGGGLRSEVVLRRLLLASESELDSVSSDAPDSFEDSSCISLDSEAWDATSISSDSVSALTKPSTSSSAYGIVASKSSSLTSGSSSTSVTTHYLSPPFQMKQQLQPHHLKTNYPPGDQQTELVWLGPEALTLADALTVAEATDGLTKSS